MAFITVPYAPPSVQLPGSIGSPPTFGAAASSHINQYDFCQLLTGNLIPAAVGATTNLVGVATADSNAVFFQNDTDIQGVFGVTQMSTTAGLFPLTPDYVLVETLGPPIIVEMSVNQAYSWITSSGGSPALTVNIGTRIGLDVVNSITGSLGQVGGITPTSGFNYYIASPAQSACGTVVALVNRPYNSGTQTFTQPPAGTVGVRVLVAFDTSALAVVQGH